jgi:hypothetical protein
LRFALAFTLCLLATGLTPHAQAADDILVIDETVDPPVEILLTEEQILALDSHVIETKTEFTDGVPRFEGPLVIDVLTLAGLATHETAQMVAVNDYSVLIPISDFRDYDVILAHRMNGKSLSRRDKGPYWVMYPLDEYGELSDPLYNNRLIWQLVEIRLQ